MVAMISWSAAQNTLFFPLSVRPAGLSDQEMMRSPGSSQAAEVAEQSAFSVPF